MMPVDLALSISLLLFINANRFLKSSFGRHWFLSESWIIWVKCLFCFEKSEYKALKAHMKIIQPLCIPLWVISDFTQDIYLFQLFSVCSRNLILFCDHFDWLSTLGVIWPGGAIFILLHTACMCNLFNSSFWERVSWERRRKPF